MIIQDLLGRRNVTFVTLLSIGVKFFGVHINNHINEGLGNFFWGGGVLAVGTRNLSEDLNTVFSCFFQISSK